MVAGTNVQVEPPHRLVFTWGWEHDGEPTTTVTVTISEEVGGTRLVLEHAETEQDAGEDGHRGGWEITLGRLADALG